MQLTLRQRTGATGYIGGDILYALKQKYPDYNITALVRTAEKEKLVKDSYPDVRVVQGDNDSSDLLEKEAAAADIVIRESISKPVFDRGGETGRTSIVSDVKT